MEQNFLGYLLIIIFPAKHTLNALSPNYISSPTRLVKPFVTINTLRMIYYYYFHSVMTYGLLFWGNSPDSIKIFRLQKKIVRIMTGCRSTDSCRKLFINLEILPLPSQYILSLLFMLRNKNQFLVNSEIHHIDNRQHANFQQPSVNVTK